MAWSVAGAALSRARLVLPCLRDTIRAAAAAGRGASAHHRLRHAYCRSDRGRNARRFRRTLCGADGAGRWRLCACRIRCGHGACGQRTRSAAAGCRSGASCPARAAAERERAAAIGSIQTSSWFCIHVCIEMRPPRVSNTVVEGQRIRSLFRFHASWGGGLVRLEGIFTLSDCI